MWRCAGKNLKQLSVKHLLQASATDTCSLASQSADSGPLHSQGIVWQSLAKIWPAAHLATGAGPSQPLPPQADQGDGLTAAGRHMRPPSCFWQCPRSVLLMVLYGRAHAALNVSFTLFAAISAHQGALAGAGSSADAGQAAPFGAGMFRGLPYTDMNALSGASEDQQSALDGMQLTPDVEQLLNEAASFDAAMLSLEEAQMEAGLVGGCAGLRVSNMSHSCHVKGFQGVHSSHSWHAAPKLEPLSAAVFKQEQCMKVGSYSCSVGACRHPLPGADPGLPLPRGG